VKKEEMKNQTRREKRERSALKRQVCSVKKALRKKKTCSISMGVHGKGED